MITEAEKQLVRDLAERLGHYHYGKYTGKADPKYVIPKGKNGKLAPLPSDAIDRHLSGEQPIALPTTSHPDENKAQIVIFDFDDHDGTCDPQRMIDTVCEFSTCLGAAHVIELSGSGTGYHIWLAFERPMTRHYLIETAEKRLAAFSDRHPTLALAKGSSGGVAGGKVEIFPNGNLIALPFGRRLSMIVEPKKVDGRWTLPRVTEPKLTLIAKQKPGPKPAGQGTKQPDCEAAFNAFVSPLDPNEYDDWSKGIIPHVKAAFQDDLDWARARWEAWSKTAANPADDRALEAKWQSFDPWVSPATFWLTARDRGYSGPLPFSKREEREHDVQGLLAEIELHRGEDGLAYAHVGPRRVVLVESEEFQDFLRLTAADRGTIIKTDEVREPSALAAARARAKDPSAIALRFGRDGERRFVFHADSVCSVTEIDAKGWRPCAKPPILFRRGDGKPLPQPVVSSIDVFHEVLNITPDGLIFLLAWMVNAIVVPGGQSPIALVTGPHGAAKTSGMGAVVSCLDPKVGSLAGPPKTEEDLMVAANGSGLVSFDNASSLAHLSDPLCRLSTGGGLRRRKLYTNHGIASLDVTRPVILTGIDPTVYNQDLVDRIIYVPLIRPETYMSDEAFNALLVHAVPRMTGALFSLVSQVLGMLPQIASAGRFRFDTFARIGECVAIITGKEDGWFAREYEAQRREASQDAADGDSVLSFILYLCRTQHDDMNRLELNATALLDLMAQKVANREIFAAREDMPANPRVLSSRLARIIPTLNDYGIRVRRGNQRAFVIEWEGADLSAFDQFMLAQMPF